MCADGANARRRSHAERAVSEEAVPEETTRSLQVLPVSSQNEAVEIVECKGLGHPDAICDALADPKAGGADGDAVAESVPGISGRFWIHTAPQSRQGIAARRPRVTGVRWRARR